MPSLPDPSTTDAAATQRRILAIAWPVMLSNITVPLLGLVDSAILGHLDDASHLGAVALGAQLFTLLCWSFGFLRMGTTASSARSRTPAELQQALQQGLWLALLLVVPVATSGWLLLPAVIPLMEASAAVSDGARDYLLIRCLSIPATLCQYVLMGWFIGRSETRAPLLVMTVTNLSNALLDALFVFGLDMTASGVAAGSVMADYSGLALALWLVRSSGDAAPAHLPGPRPRWQTLQPLIRVNRDLFIRTLLLLLVLTLFQAAGAQQGDLVLAANSLLMSLLLLISNALDGFANAAESLTGQTLARGRPQQVRQVLILSGLNSLAMAVALSLALLLAGSALWPLFTDNPLLLPVLAEYQTFLLWLPIVGFGSFWVDGLCIGAGASRIMRNGMMLSALLFLLLWQSLTFLGNSGLWLALYGFFMVRACAALPFVIVLYRQPRQWVPVATSDKH